MHGRFVAGILVVAIAIALHVELPQRVLTAYDEYQPHRRLRYALAFLVAPYTELAPAPRALKSVPVPGECRARCTP
jgi:hypothetical protein